MSARKMKKQRGIRVCLFLNLFLLILVNQLLAETRNTSNSINAQANSYASSKTAKLNVSDKINVEQEKAFITENIKFAVAQNKQMLQSLSCSKRMPHSATSNGKLIKGSVYLWTAGFFPGMLWYNAELSNDKDLRDSALVYTRMMEPVKTFKDNHDIGFMMNCSYGNALKFTKDERINPIIIESAKSLISRFNKKAGVIQSWNSFDSWHGDKTYNFPVIIDNMMNLELLFNATKISGNPIFKEIAISHAEKVMKYQVRKDFSCFHIIYYDKETGKPIKGETSQGYSDNSSWSRGQSWGIYGFTMVYRETKDKRFLEVAKKMADFYINHPNLPSDKVAYWDFNAYQKGYTPGKLSNANLIVSNYRDASAAACTASALMELSEFCTGKQKEIYFQTAKQILHSLAGPAYRAKAGENCNFILKHSVGSIPHYSEIDVPLIYADYYFVEALYRYNSIINRLEIH